MSTLADFVVIVQCVGNATFVCEVIHSFFFSVLRQFKIVKPTRQPEGKKQTLKNKLASAYCVDVEYNKNLIYFIYQQ
jgi:hypothetical protein